MHHARRSQANATLRMQQEHSLRLAVLPGWHAAAGGAQNPAQR